jgi:hypothetical protein
MRRLQRFVSASVLLALSGALSGCGSTGSWDPTDMLDFLDTKKKLPGERKPVFPEGVPGLQPGVPKELYKGSNRDPLAQPQDVAVAPAALPAAEPKAGKRGAKSKGQPPAMSAAAPAQDPAAQDTNAAAPEEDGNIAAAPPAPPPKKIVRRRTTSLPNDEPAPAPRAQPAQPAQQAQSPAASPFPAPLPSGTFQR